MRPTLRPSGVSQKLTQSQKIAKRALAEAMIALGRSDEPARVFAENREVIVTALVLLGRSEEAKRLVAQYESPSFGGSA